VFTFPDDFLDGDRQYRAVIQSEPTPVLYVTANSSYICAAGLNSLLASLDDEERRGGSWTPVTYELLTFDPAVCCEVCSHSVTPLHLADGS